ncbi:radical SAM protein [Methanoregula sp.]|uniref:B12-binding domain-containing radical SAM protein n=1 Tax=Methanoregula sp. TaxID=2052170 RepID=UPI003564D4D8
MGLASLSAFLKAHGHSVKIFDTAFYGSTEEKSQTIVRTERLMSKPITDEDHYMPVNQTTVEEDLLKTIRKYQPHLIAFSIVEPTYDQSLKLSRFIKKHFNTIPVVAGGVFPTLSPDIVIAEESIDMVCLGEGETILNELCERLAQKSGYTDVTGLWVKKDGVIHKNDPPRLLDINTLPFPDFTEFDPRLFYKPMQGKMYKMINIASSRGCPNQCTFCGAPQLRKFFKQYDCGLYYRHLTAKRLIEHIQYEIKVHNPDFIYFSTENFLSMKEDDFQTFITEYRKIKIPFWIQTRIDTITKERLEALREIGLLWITLGLEHGNEEFRTTILKRKYTNKLFLERMEILRDLGMGATLNNIIGFPFETRELVFDTIRLNRQLYERNPRLESNVCVFTPFRGCDLYTICKENGLLGDEAYTSSQDQDEQSVLKFPKEFADTIAGMVRTFNLYIQLPEKYFEDLKIAETPTEEGDRMRKKLLGICHKLEQEALKTASQDPFS